MNAPLAPIDLDLLEIDPRPCELCGLTIDQHVMVDDGEGPEFFCEETDPYAADIVRQWELADPRDAWRHTGEPPPPASVRNSDTTAKPTRSQRPAESTVQEFWHVVTREPEKLKTWLARHPGEAPALHQIWKAKRCQ
jgi:hypothetical protein